MEVVKRKLFPLSVLSFFLSAGFSPVVLAQSTPGLAGHGDDGSGDGDGYEESDGAAANGCLSGVLEACLADPNRLGCELDLQLGAVFWMYVDSERFMAETCAGGSMTLP